jgi:hypothetical protein
MRRVLSLILPFVPKALETVAVETPSFNANCLMFIFFCFMIAYGGCVTDYA